MKLRDYILQNYDGNNAAWGRANNRSKSAVSKMVKDGRYYVVNGRLMLDRGEVKQENQ